MTSISNSLDNRSCTMSICNIPKNPHLNPKPSATELSGVKVSDASLSCNFSSDVRNSSYILVSMGYTPAYTIGFTSAKPSIAFSQGRSVCVMVSPTLTSTAFLMPEMM